MRLLNADTLKFEEFFGTEIPPYCILSHRWSHRETSFKNFRRQQHTESRGYRKIVDFCDFVRDRRGRYRCYVWIDTCCIDKRSSAELSSAINSMYQWYANAIECYVYLADVTSEIKDSEWFSRGWTLQELLAPTKLIFVNKDWKVLGHKCTVPPPSTVAFLEQSMRDPCTAGLPRPDQNYHAFTRGLGSNVLGRSLGGPDLNLDIIEATGIPERYLRQPELVRSASVAERISWASKRKTTVSEDEAYCLMGILGVNMPLLYGEGGRMAFMRLQEEIIKRSTDHTILAWRPEDPSDHIIPGVLATAPSDFALSGGMIRSDPVTTWPYSMTNFGLQIRARAQPALGFSERDDRRLFVVPLNCRENRDHQRPAQVYLVLFTHHNSHSTQVDPLFPFAYFRAGICAGENEVDELCERFGTIEVRDFLIRQ